MRLAYLLIFVPALIVGVAYFGLFHSMGVQVHALPFVVAAAGFGAALIVVRYFLRRHAKRPGSSGS